LETRRATSISLRAISRVRNTHKLTSEPFSSRVENFWMFFWGSPTRNPCYSVSMCCPQ
jgi:hypothetical protein